MEEEKIRKITLEHPSVNAEVFVPFFMERFPLETMESYVRDWCRRFERGTPEVYMDLESTIIYREAIQNHQENIILSSTEE